MALYRKEKINPASGCLPVLIQIPFFLQFIKCFYIFGNEAPAFFWLDKRFISTDPTTLFNFLV